jgi:glycosyltransferase involved in cell wall biosynthesis
MASPDISVIFATYNRADMLRQTLEAMTRLDLQGLNVEFVVVDNNSNDNTGQVIDSFKDRLPVVHLFEPRQGKNRALNHALNAVELGDIVVFTDDDVVPCEDWLHQIAACCKRWPEYSVFGGKIDPIWPKGVKIPTWARESQDLQAVVFGIHNLGDADMAYGDIPPFPFGPNFWVRRGVFSDGRRYDESIGPKPGSFRMGSESSFLLKLAADGFGALYTPKAAVGHHIEAKYFSGKGLVARLIRYGRADVTQNGVNRQRLLSKNKILWYFRTLISLFISYLRMLAARLIISKSRRAERIALVARWRGYDLESLKVVWQEYYNRRE